LKYVGFNIEHSDFLWANLSKVFISFLSYL
jgi:hypothetical protein